MSWQGIALVSIALLFGFFNGLHDSSNVVATVISTRAMRPRMALWVAALANGIGPLLFGVAIATTIGSHVIAAEAVTMPVVFAALFAAIAWNLITLVLGIPSSTSHALVGGLVGPALVSAGPDAIQAGGLLTVVFTLFSSPLMGLLAGYWITRLCYFLVRGATPRVNHWFQRGQVVTAITLALSHGTNDAQITMGIISLGLVATGSLTVFYVPYWVVASSAAVMGLGTLFGGWSLVRTLGSGFYRLRPVHGFAAQTASSVIILGAALVGGPVSTTHVVSTAIVGAGSADRVQKVRWGVVGAIVRSWFLTIPTCALLGGLFYVLLADVL
jgi:inorganic phosphate transporter, PiT family